MEVYGNEYLVMICGCIVAEHFPNEDWEDVFEKAKRIWKSWKSGSQESATYMYIQEFAEAKCQEWEND